MTVRKCFSFVKLYPLHWIFCVKQRS